MKDGTRPRQTRHSESDHAEPN